METRRIELINRQHIQIGTITWTSEGRISSEIFDAYTNIAEAIEETLKKFLKEGVYRKTSKQVQQSGKQIILDTVEHLKATDLDFPIALADCINKTSFAGQRVFALPKKSEKESSK